jgi:hypothetical protein
MKKVSFGGKPSATNPSADAWVENREIEPAKEPMKRLTIDVPVSLHKRIKSQCVMQELVMADVIRDMLEQRFPSREGGSS